MKTEQEYKDEAETSKEKKSTEYIVVSDRNSEVIMSTLDRHEARRMAGKVRKAGGEVTIFRSTLL